MKTNMVSHLPKMNSPSRVSGSILVSARKKSRKSGHNRFTKLETETVNFGCVCDLRFHDASFVVAEVTATGRQLFLELVLSFCWHSFCSTDTVSDRLSLEACKHLRSRQYSITRQELFLLQFSPIFSARK